MSGSPLAVTLGDPAGVGPEIIVKAWRALQHGGPLFAVIGDGAALEALGAPVQRIADLTEADRHFSTRLPILDRPLTTPAMPGRPSPEAASSVIGWIETAAALALSGAASGVVTAPIAKATLYAAGFAYPGHTEFLGALAPGRAGNHGAGPVMMLTAGDLRVSLVTIHEALARVPGLLTTRAIVNAGLVTAAALKMDFGLGSARLAVCGLNPHAGEGGALGDEEIRIIAPAIAKLRALGVDATGPHPADSLFHAEARARYDAALCQYHDQALIPVKMLDFWGGVNITLGLSIVRASPDHGTGFDIAGQGVARADSLIAALRLAADMAACRARM